jgi:hypothetical protein
VPIDLTALPDDPATLQQMLREVVAAAAQQQVALQGAVSERDAEIEKLRLLIQRLLRHQFGRRSEKLSADQLQLGLEDLEQDLAANEAAQDEKASQDSQARSRYRRMPNATTAPAIAPAALRGGDRRGQPRLPVLRRRASLDR